MKRQGVNFKALMRTISSIDVSKLENQWQFEKALRELENCWRAVDKQHWEIETENGEQDRQYQRQFSEYETIYQNQQHIRQYYRENPNKDDKPNVSALHVMNYVARPANCATPNITFGNVLIFCA